MRSHMTAQEIFHFFTHVEKGFLKTTGQLIFYPGRLCRKYLEGKRKAYHKPVSFFLIWVAIYLFIWYLVDHFAHFENRYTDDLITWGSSTVNIVQKYRSLVDILILPRNSLYQLVDSCSTQIELCRSIVYLILFILFYIHRAYN